MNINKITTEGIYYTNDSNMNDFLSFSECNENWLAYRKRTESLSEERLSQLRGKDKTVGQRDIEEAKCFIEFFWRPFIRFEFNNPEQIDEYRKIRDLIHKYGWTTHDLS